MVTWVDTVVVMLLIFVALVEVKRGFGRAIFDLLALVIAMRLAFILRAPLTNTIQLSANPAANEAILYSITFIIIGGILVFLGHIVYSLVLLSADVFDPALGGVCGFFVGIILCHALVTAIDISAGTQATSVVSYSMLGNEFLTFDTYHNLVNRLYDFNRIEPLPE